MQEELAQLTIRNAEPQDMPYVLHTWAKSYGNRISKHRRKYRVPEFRKSFIDPVMRAAPGILVVCSKDSPNTLHGYIVVADSSVAWLYVASSLRGLGIAKNLIVAALGNYPDVVHVRQEWPYPSNRFKFERLCA